MTKKIYQEELSNLIDLGEKTALDGFEKIELVEEFVEKLEEFEEEYDKEFITPEGFRSVGYYANYYSEEENKWEKFPVERDIDISYEFGDKEITDDNKDKAHLAAINQFWAGINEIINQLKELEEM